MYLNAKYIYTVWKSKCDNQLELLYCNNVTLIDYVLTLVQVNPIQITIVY